MSDPSRFSGVQVNDVEALEKARRIRGIKLDRPVVISTPAENESPEPPEKCLVIAPEEHALYNKEAAIDYRARLMALIDESDSEIITARDELDTISSLSGEYQQYVQRYGQGRIITIRSEVEVAKNQMKRRISMKKSFRIPAHHLR